MEMFVAVFNPIVGVSVIAMQIAIVCILVVLLGKHAPTLRWIGKWKKELLLAVSGIALAGSLTYSYIIGFTACYLCWIQRLLIVPPLVIAAISIARKSANRTAVKWSLPFIGIGTIVAIYHTLIQNGIGTGNALCQAVGGTSCTQLYVNEFGYITIPVMSLTVFVLLLLISLVKTPKQ